MPLVFYNTISNLSFIVFFNSQKHYVVNDLINNASFEEHLILILNYHVATLLWPSVGVKPNTWKKLGLESSGTPENSEDDLEDQNTSYWGVLSVIEKVLKRRYRKCPRILDLDICSPSYGQKKGRESNWQFDSRPLKVGNRPAPDVRFGSAIRRWKDLDEGYNFG
jgi:hypothetical protein